MKHFTILLILSSLLYGCNSKDTSSQLVGTWQLVSQRVDIGNGKSTFNAIESNKTIEFKENGELVSNGALCYLSELTRTPSTGFYHTEDNTITAKSCDKSVLKIRYELVGENLIISYPCSEPCQQKYKKQ